jgi:hypothetical protein
LILLAWPESSRRRFNRVSNWPFISRLFHGALSHLDFICRNRHIIGTVPDPSNGFEESTAIDDMAQIKSMESEDPCEPPLRPQSRSRLFFIGTDRHGNWVVRDQTRLCGGLFVNRSEALRFAMLENGHRPQAVIMVPGILEFSVDGPATAAANDSTGVAETNRRVLAS